MLVMRDYSVYQGHVLWIDGIDVGAVKKSQGIGYDDPLYGEHVDQLRAAGKRLVHYLFGEHAVSAIAEVARFKAGIKYLPGDVLAYDWESYNKTFPTQAERDEARDALRANFPEARLVLYCNRNFYFNIDTTHARGWDGLWIADPSNAPGHPGIRDPWWGHQYGIVNNTDVNVLNFGSLAAYDKWARGLIKTPAPVQPVPPKPTPAPSPKPPRKPAWTDKTTLNGHTVNFGTLQAFNWVVRYVGWSWIVGRVIQGSYTGGVAASGGTHAGGGALDIDVRGLSAEQIAVLLTWFRWVGFAAWHRLPSQGPWIEHIHCILIGDPALSSQAAAQVLAYRNHKNGLANNGADDFPYQPFRPYQYAAA